MSKNGDIRGFFQKKNVRPSATNSNSNLSVVAEPEQLHDVQARSPSAEPFLNLPSSPITPQKSTVKSPRTRDTEIKGSEDDDDSDGSLVSLSELIGRKSGPSYQRPAVVTTTPKAKRIAYSAGFHKSPLTLQQQPKHKFDIKTLVNHSKQNNATEESGRRAEQAKLQAEKELEPEVDPDRMAGELYSDEDETKGDKLAMAIDRTAGDESHPRAYFFDLEEPPRKAARRPFPKNAAKAKPWNILHNPSSRNQMFIHGIPTVLVRKGKELPEELYLWILDEICIENDLQLRNQYLNLASLCHDDARCLINEEQLYRMLERIGGQKHSTVDASFELSPGLKDPYPGRDWSPLRYFLKLLEQVAPNMSPENNIDAIKLLIRLSLDPIIAKVAGLRVAYSKAMLALVSELPLPEEQWNDCCEKICTYLYRGVSQATQRNTAVILLPTSTPRTVELQRRLATEALLGEPNLGARHPDDSVTIQDILTRVAEPDFQIAGSTNFAELNALISLLDIVTHDGSHLYRAHLFPPTPSSNSNSNSSSTQALLPTPASLASPSASPSPALEAEARSNYDKDIDRLITQLKVLHDKISDNTLVSKKEAKLALDGLMKRLTYTVRSRPPPKASLFDDILGRKDYADLPRQKDFMKKWAASKAASAASEAE